MNANSEDCHNVLAPLRAIQSQPRSRSNQHTTCMSVRLLKVYMSSTLMVASLADVVICANQTRHDSPSTSKQQTQGAARGHVSQVELPRATRPKGKPASPRNSQKNTLHKPPPTYRLGAIGRRLVRQLRRVGVKSARPRRLEVNRRRHGRARRERRPRLGEGAVQEGEPLARE